MVSQRASGKRQGWFTDLARDLMNVVSDGSVPELLKALEALRVVIQHSAENILSLSPALSEMVTVLWDHPDAEVQEAVIALMPVLMQMCPQKFASTLFSPCMDQFTAFLQKRT